MAGFLPYPIMSSLVISKIKPPLLREVVAGPGQPSVAVGFGLALAAETLSAPSETGAALLWVREAAAVVEAGTPYGPGLAAFGLSPDHLVIVEARTPIDALRAALEGARCAVLGAVVLETVAPIDLTASRRLKLAAEKSGVAIVLVRLGVDCEPNAAPIRWRVQAAPQAPDQMRRTAFEIIVLKSRSGLDGNSRIVEWNHDRQCFEQTLFMPLDAVSGIGSLAA